MAHKKDKSIAVIIIFLIVGCIVFFPSLLYIVIKDFCKKIRERETHPLLRQVYK